MRTAECDVAKIYATLASAVWDPRTRYMHKGEQKIREAEFKGKKKGSQKARPWTQTSDSECDAAATEARHEVPP